MGAMGAMTILVMKEEGAGLRMPVAHGVSNDITLGNAKSKMTMMATEETATKMATHIAPAATGMVIWRNIAGGDQKTETKHPWDF